MTNNTKNPKKDPKKDPNLRVLRIIANGNRSKVLIQKVLKVDPSPVLRNLMAADSIRRANSKDYGVNAKSDYILTRKGAGQLRFAS